MRRGLTSPVAASLLVLMASALYSCGTTGLEHGEPWAAP